MFAVLHSTGYAYSTPCTDIDAQTLLRIASMLAGMPGRYKSSPTRDAGAVRAILT